MRADVQPWEQQPGEPDEAYKRFCVYRDLGPSRTLVAACGAREGKKKKQVDGAWGADSSQWNWVRRAHAWDVHNLQRHSDDVSILLVNAIRDYALQLVRAITERTIQPTNWQELTDGLHFLSTVIPPDALAAILQPAPPPAPEPAKPFRPLVA